VSWPRALLPWLPAALQALSAGSVKERVRRAATLGALGVVVVSLAATALGFALAASYLALSTQMTPPAAAALVAAALALLAAIVALVAAVVSRRGRSRRGHASDESAEGASPVRQLTRLIEAKPVESAIVAAVLGIILGGLDRQR